MRPTVSRAVQALIPIAVCVALPLLESHLASKEDSARPRAQRAAPHPDEYYSYTNTVPPERYFANDTLLGRPFPCTDREKECLRYNRIYFPLYERCYPLGNGPARCRFAVDRCEFEHRTGHVLGHCAATDLCPPYKTDQVKMAYDGQCVRMGKLNTVCGEGPVNIAQHFFGDTECVLPQSMTPPEQVYIAQPEERGRCVFPNLRHDLTSVVNQEQRVLFKECSERQSVCFAGQKVWLESTQSCHQLLKRGPCEEGSWVVLNRTAWEEGDVEGTCMSMHPCKNNSDQYRLMAFDRVCYDAATILRVLCPGGVLLPNAFGEMSCVTRDYYKHVIELKSVRPQTCELTHKVSYDDKPSGVMLEPECGITESGSCVDAF